MAKTFWHWLPTALCVPIGAVAGFTATFLCFAGSFLPLISRNAGALILLAFTPMFDLVFIFFITVAYAQGHRTSKIFAFYVGMLLGQGLFVELILLAVSNCKFN